MGNARHLEKCDKGNNKELNHTAMTKDMKTRSCEYYICVTPFFPSPDNWRGVYVLDQVKAIQRHSTLKVLVFMPSRREGEYEIDGIKVYLFGTRQTPSYIFNGLFNKYNASKFIKRVNSAGVNMDDIKFAHCHSGQNGYYGIALRERNPKIKVLLQHHDLDPLTVMNGKLAGWKPNSHYRARKSVSIFNEVDLHICISEPVRESLLSFPHARKAEVYEPYIKRMRELKGFPSVAPKDLYILNNGVDTRMFHPADDLKADTGNPRIFRIGCIANFQHLKDHITLIRAFEILVGNESGKFRLSLLGTGPTRPFCERYVREHNLTEYVEWPDEVTHDKLPDYYRCLDLFVLPSIFEGFGCVYTEAAACGVPFMGVLNQGASECICDDEKQKWLIAPKDYEGLAEKIKDYYHHRYVQKLSREYDIDVLVKRFLDYLNICTK